MSFGNFLKERRKERGLSIVDIEKRSGVGKPHIFAIEEGRIKSPTMRIAAQLAPAYRLSVAEFVMEWVRQET